ncbi:unnamed protein product [Orchesella dallaii]|uniref:C2H2-type domain-containing protein n=1 Tax=Orchesella dallaii TaxID=48710 RepID=A0ABP1PMS3_9HEXA
MDIRISCPICGQADVGNLPNHLQSHSKQSLIEILLEQHQQIRKQHPVPNPSVHVVSRDDDSSHVDKASKENTGSTGSNRILVEFQSESNDTDDEGNNETPVKVKNDLSTFPTPGHRHRKTVQPSSVFHVELAPSPSTATDVFASEAHSPKPSSVQELIKVETNSTSTSSSSESDALSRGISCRQPTFVLVDHGQCKPGPSRKTNTGDANDKLRTDNSSDVTSGIPPGTSIIQYIIDESGQINDSPQEEADNWILADGRTIPVYSSLTQVPAVSDNTPSCTMTVDISSKGHEAETIPVTVERNGLQSQMHLNLMTDEEIPPRGEISEYEESNASSIMSEDSNIRPVGILSDSRRSPVIHEQNVFLSRKKKSPKATLHQQYVCYECPQLQVFCSLFELAEHKFESHQNKMGSNNATVTLSSDQNSVHILPEKIRRQSRDDQLEMDIPTQDPLADIPNEVVPAATTSTSTKKEYFCVYCSFTSKKKSLLADHMETEHAGKPRTPNMFECTYCGKIFQARTNLRKHLLIHKERKYNCPTCSKGFTSNFKLTEHIRVHTKLYPYKCTGCEKTYRTISLLNHHMKMVHLPEGQRPPKRKLEFYCGVCHRVLHSKRSYLNHCQLHQEKPIKCSFCSETFTRHSVLVRHIRIAHDSQYESKESKDCPVCQKKLHPNSMIKHMRIHANEKPYSCNVCGKFFRTYANLTSHSWSHTNVDKPHKCRLCSKSYLFKKNLENHMMVHKKRTMHFVCNECGVKFTHKVNMKRHLEEHFKEKNHVCKVCGKAFQRNYYLIEHERIHSGVKPFTCNICGKASTTKSNHRAHLKIHDARETGNQEG